MISFESIITNSKIENVFILSYYDGIKEEVDIENKTIFLWYDYASDVQGEYWLKIEANTPQILFNYLNNKVGIKDLIDNSIIFLCVRLYKEYSEFKLKEKLHNFDNIDLPENVYLGYDFLSKLEKANLKRIVYSQHNISSFNNENIMIPNIHSRTYCAIDHFENTYLDNKIKNTNEEDDLFYPIAA